MADIANSRASHEGDGFLDIPLILPFISDALRHYSSKVFLVRVLVVLPTYNEAANIEKLLTSLSHICPDANTLVVDDSSPDGTAQVVQQLIAKKSKLSLIQRPAKMGLGSAYLDGFKWGLEQGFDVLVQIDSDFQHDPNDIPQMLAKIQEGYGLVLGSRYVKGGQIPDWIWFRRFLSKWGNLYSRAMLRLTVNDATSGFRAWRADTLRHLEPSEIKSNGYGFQIETVFKISKITAKITEVPIIFSNRSSGKSKMNSKGALEAFLWVTFWGVRERWQTIKQRLAQMVKNRN